MDQIWRRVFVYLQHKTHVRFTHKVTTTRKMFGYGLWCQIQCKGSNHLSLASQVKKI